MSTQVLRNAFQFPNLFQPAEMNGYFIDPDRLVAGGVMPSGNPIELPNHKETGRAFFLERHELGAINSGGPWPAKPDARRHGGGEAIQFEISYDKTI